MWVNLYLEGGGGGEGLHLRGCPGNEVNMASIREDNSILHGKGGKVASLSAWRTKAKDKGWASCGKVMRNWWEDGGKVIRIGRGAGR